GYITTPTNTYDMGIRQHATFNIWFNCKNFTAVRYLLSDTDDVPALQGMSMYTTATTGVLAASVYPNNHRITSTVSPVIGKDHLLTFVMNGANEYLYLDGVQIGTAELNEDIGSSASPFRIGTRGDLDNVVTRCATSDISLVSVYNRAFSLNEIQQLKIDPFQMFRPPFDLYLIGGVVIPGISGGQLIMIQEL
ncbi:MAG: hypothetical protein IMZ71_01110, partial [Chloroflexi bacterium]|nr:hypothetical protein [Chloroflexota bacterium]